MGIYIKDLDMPTTCEECIGYREDGWYGASCLFLQDEDGWAVEIDDGFTDEYDLEQERHPKCPLIELDDEMISKFAEAYLEREAEDGDIHT